MPIMATKLCRDGFDLGDKCLVGKDVCQISAVGEKNMGYKIVPMSRLRYWAQKAGLLRTMDIPTLLNPKPEEIK